MIIEYKLLSDRIEKREVRAAKALRWLIFGRRYRPLIWRFFSFAAIVLPGEHLFAGDTGMIIDKVTWQQIAQLAHAVVAQETGPTAWPFKLEGVDTLRSSKKKVFAHYMPFFVLSYENDPLDRDHWAQFLSPSGERGKWAPQGGLTRERPLTPPPWNSRYWREINAAIEVLRAQQIGLDGFGVDLTNLEPAEKLSQVRVLCTAAAVVAPGFRIMLEPDTGILQNATPQQMAETIKFLAACPAIYRLPDNRILIAPFWTERQSVEYWRTVLTTLTALGENVALLSDLLGLGEVATEFAPVSYGLSFWGPRDPTAAVSPSLRAAEAAAKSQVRAWMLPIAPQDVRPKDSVFWEASNTEIFRTLWHQAITDNLESVHIITWNDYSESTEISPSSGTQFLFYDLSAYYINWFKMGRPPAIISDAIYYSHRTELIPPAGEGSFHLNGETGVRNGIEMLAMLTGPSALAIQVGEHHYTKSVGAGLQSFWVPAEPGRPVFSIERNGRRVASTASNWEIGTKSAVENPVYFGGSSTRAFVPIPHPSGNWK